MGYIILLNPNGINQELYTILKTEKEDILRMGITNRETEGRFADQSVKYNVFIVFPRGDVEKDILAIKTRSDD